MPADPDQAWRRLARDRGLEAQLGALWGKSAERAGGTVNLLLQHLFDAMAVGSLIWDRYLALGLRRRLEEAVGGDGRRLYVWLCGLHDVGKASPAFQRMKPRLGEQATRAGLPLPPERQADGPWRHERAGAMVLREVLDVAWPEARDQLDWIWPMVAGHHGVFYGAGQVQIRPQARDRRRRLQGDESWGTVQRALVDIVTAVAGWADLGAACPRVAPSRADQLALSGFVTMADWIASDEHRFQGVDRWEAVSVACAHHRAQRAWEDIGFQPGWGESLAAERASFVDRFGKPPRPFQEMAVEAATAMPAPGLLVLEAPMGEGKTEAALAAAEVLAARFGADGVYVAMPTQATSDAMYERVERWLRSFGRPLPLALLHGRRRLSELARGQSLPAIPPDQVEGRGATEVDGYGMSADVPSFAGVCEDHSPGTEQSDRPAEWFFGRRRGLLAANGVGTIDQALYAGTRTRYVALRYAGLAGKVVIFDEVHAADAYMTEFLGDLLRWLGNGGVPVVLLSATLAPGQREKLVREYVEGATIATRTAPKAVPSVVGYPSALTASVDAEVSFQVRTGSSWRPSAAVKVSICLEPDLDDPVPIVEMLRDKLSDGGCVLVIRNTVARAQDTYRHLLDDFGDDAVLLHSRFTSNTRWRTTQRLLDALGPSASARPRRLVVVATQVAEQSFDVDADLLVTDLAPVDLMLQRAGRTHRHERPASDRPAALCSPEVVVTGLRLSGDRPWFPPGSEAVYGRHHLLRAAAVVRRAAGGKGWSIPADVPQLVAEAYGPEPSLPGSWAQDAAQAAAEWKREVNERRDQAAKYLLTVAGQQHALTLAGLHALGAHDRPENHVRVRDGETAEEVILVIDDDGDWRTVDGIRLGPNGDAARDRPGEVLGACVRLPDGRGLQRAAEELEPLPGWLDDPWLGRSRALRLDRHGHAELGGRDLSYDPALGLIVEHTR